MGLRRRLKALENQSELKESQIANLESLQKKCQLQFNGETSSATRSQLNKQIDNYSIELDELYKTLDEIDDKISQVKSSLTESSSNVDRDNPKNQQELRIDKSLCYIDFKETLETFKTIQSQFNQDGDVALFLLEESFQKRGDLYLLRLENELKPKHSYRDNYRRLLATYTLGDEETINQRVTQDIATSLGVTQKELSIDLVVQKIADSLQRNSTFFIEIICDIDCESDVDPLIPWLVNKLWKPLNNKVKEITENKKYTGIKIFAVIHSNLEINKRFSTESLSHYYNPDFLCFEPGKFVKIPLQNWTKNEIKEWLDKYSDPSLTQDIIANKANRLFTESSEGIPRLVCDALQQQWRTLIYSITSC